MAYFDMHCHLDFAPQGHDAAQEIEAVGAGAFAVSVLPANPPQGGCVRWGIGLHPWWIADGRAGNAEIETLLAAIPTHTYIGEIGLDFGKTHGGDEEAHNRQKQAFEQVINACAQVGQRVLSLHSVAASEEVFSTLKQSGALETCPCIFHWYSGDSDTLHHAIEAGCSFSVGSFMLETKRGREYVRQIPASQLLLETDYPPAGQPYEVALMQAQLAKTCNAIAALRGEEAYVLAEQIEQNSRSLLSCA